MATEQTDTETVYEVYCRDCDWQAPDTVDLKGLANVLAGKHISETGHVVALKAIETEAADESGEFYRGGRRSVSIELLKTGDDVDDSRQCGPVRCVVESA